MPLQIRRGTAAERDSLSAPLVIGELLYTTDTGRLYIGDGTALGGPDIQGNVGQGGKGLTITGFTSEDAQDATATLFSNGSHSNISFTYNDSANSLSATLNLNNYVGNVTIDGTLDVTGDLQASSFKGSIFADNSTLLVDAVSGSIPYSVISGAPTLISTFTNDAGYITAAQVAGGTITIDVNNTGDLQGNVFGDDSTLLVDAINSIIPASVVTGTFTGNVVGNVTGDLVGNVTGGDITGNNISGNIIITNLISSDDSSSIFCDTPFVFETTLRVQSQLVVEDEGSFLATDAAQFPLSITAAHNDDLATSLTVRRSRGSINSPSALTNQDRVGTLVFSGYDGSSFRPSASIQARVTGTVSSGVVPGSLRFLVTAQDGTELEAMTINQVGNILLNARSSVQAPLQITTIHNDGSNPSRAFFIRQRLSGSSPLVVQSTDPIFELDFLGYDGSTNTTAAKIRATVNGSVSSGVVPGKLDLITSDSAGTSASRVEVQSTKTTFNNMPVLPTYADDTAADAAIGGSGSRVNGMMFYNTGLGVVRVVIGGAWASLNYSF